MLKLLTFFVAPLLGDAVPAPKGVGRLPALGWNSWNAYNCDINEKHFLDAAQDMIDLGLKDAGYEYVNIDDCWSEPTRDKKSGRILPDLKKFPDGINGTAAKIHKMGMKIGIYSSAGVYTCAGYPASLENEDIDAQTWADWGIDYLKYDNCNIPEKWQDECDWCIVDADNHMDFEPGPNGTCPPEAGNWCPDGYDFSKSKTAERYRRMQRAIEKTGRPMLYSLCEWGTAKVQSWGGDVAQSWRTTGDIFANWPRILELINENVFHLNACDFYAHPDPDMLEVGNLDRNRPHVAAETRTHFAFWAAMKSPLLIGTNLAKLNKHDLAVLTNPYLLAFNQDSTYGAPAKPYKWGTNADWTFDAKRPAEFWAGKSEKGVLVMVLNTDDDKGVRVINFYEVPHIDPKKSYNVRDVWTGQELGCVRGGFWTEVGAHDTLAVMLDGECEPETVRSGVGNRDASGFVGLKFKTL